MYKLYRSDCYDQGSCTSKLAIIFKWWDRSEKFVEWKVYDITLLGAGSDRVICWCDFMV